MGLLKQCEVAFDNPFSVLLADILHLIACDCDCVILRDSRQYFLLLQLILQDRGLFLFVSDPLLSEEGVAGGNDDCLGEYFWSGAAQKFSNKHHCAIADSGVSDLFVLSRVRHLNVFRK